MISLEKRISFFLRFLVLTSSNLEIGSTDSDLVSTSSTLEIGSKMFENCSFSVVTFLPIHTNMYLDSRITGPGIEIAYEKIRNTSLQGCKIKWINLKTIGQISCDLMEANTADVISEYYYRHLNSSYPLVAVIGTSCSYATKQLVDIATPLNFMVLEGSGVAVFLNDKNRYPTLLRFSYTQMKASQLVLQFMKLNKWKNIVVVYNAEEAIFRVLLSIADAMKSNGQIEVDTLPYYFYTRGIADLERVILEAHNQARVVLMISSPGEIRAMMLVAHSNSYTQGDHIYLGVAYFKTKNFFGTPNWKQDDLYDQDAREAFRSLFLLKQTAPNTQEFREFQERVENLALAEYNESISPFEEVNTHAIGYHDSVIAYAEMLNETLRKGGNIFDAAAVAKRMKNRTFFGVRGRLTLDENNDLNGNFEILSFQFATSSFIKVIDFPEESSVITVVDAIDWILGEPPPNEPNCGYTGNKVTCLAADETTKFAAGGTFALIAVMIVVSLLILHHLHRTTEKMEEKWWEVFPEEIFRRPITHSRVNLFESSSSTLATLNVSQTGRSLIAGPASNTATLRGQIVFIFSIEKVVRFSVKTMMELRKLRQLTKCDKLVRIVGVCRSPENPSILYEYCSRGNVHDLIKNVEIYPFIRDWNLRFSLMKDIIEGLSFIHHSWIGFHGKLRSSKCLMDQRFVVKITDYALRELRPSVNSESEMKNRLWTAPESINRMEKLELVLPETIREADIYSLGMIMMETVWLNEPVRPDRNWTFQQISDKIHRGPSEDFPMDTLCVPVVAKNAHRSHTSLSGSHHFHANADAHVISDNNSQTTEKTKNLVKLVTSCLLKDVFQRPKISFVQKTLVILAGGKVGGVAENLIDRISKYAEELERTVATRTHGLQEEQRKIEALLFEILPKTIATSLISGISVIPEEFELVTVLFSSVENFGDLVASMNPLDVVTILNDLYHLIDTALTGFECYKVETITDIYMVASGLPIRNFNRHVTEIAFFAVHLLKISANFSVRPKPDHKILLCIGFHTGTCMAGVIGQKMPRYCLFGDTINTASRMQSTSIGGKIQISETAKNFLEKQKERSWFKISPREAIMVKGKGEMQTYWLEPATIHLKTSNGTTETIECQIR